MGEEKKIRIKILPIIINIYDDKSTNGSVNNMTVRDLIINIMNYETNNY